MAFVLVKYEHISTSIRRFNMSMKEKERFEICEMFMAKAVKDRCFFGIINRFEDHDGNPAVFSKIVMPDDKYICAQAKDQKVLSKNLNEMCNDLG